MNAGLGIPLASTSGPTAMWYLTRATGGVALVLLTASLVLGILGPLRFQASRWPRFAIGTLHRDISLLVVLFTAIHILTSVLDGFAPIGLIDGLIPLHSAYRPLWLGLGAVAFDLVIALVVTSLLRARLGLRTWRLVHWLAYVSWPVAVLHGLGAGSDAKQLWMLALSAICLGAVVVAVLARLRESRTIEPALRTGLGGLTLLTPLALIIFTGLGPLQHGWAKTAGTPASLLGAGKPSAASRTLGTPAPVPVDLQRRAFTATLAGTLHESRVTGGELVDLSLRLSQGASGVLRIRLAGVPDGQGGVSLTGSQVDFAEAGVPSVLTGRVTSLVGSNFVSKVRNSKGAVVLRGQLSIDAASGVVGGRLEGGPG